MNAPIAEIRGESKRYLDVDLSTRSFSVFSPSEDDLRDYLGGKGLGLKLIYDRFGERGPGAFAAIDPLGPENILAFMMGAFLGTGAPCSARFAGLAKSPLTGIMAASSCGGPFGMACKTAGWDGLLVSGAAAGPLVLRIDEKGASFEEADMLWGLETGEAQSRLVDSPRLGALVIGPAGENGVLYANIRSGHRFLGRAGLGAVMGAKRLKAIVAAGRSYRILPADEAAFARLDEKAKRHIKRNSFTRSYDAFGTNYNCASGIESGFLPVRNFRDRTDERCRVLSGESMAERYKTSHATCAPCTVLCGHQGTYPDGKMRHIPEYETVGLWGGNIMNFDPDLVAAWNDRMNELGIDTVSCGATFGWAMEAAEKGLRPSALAFGRTDNIASALDDVAFRRGEGAELALGTKRLASRYGGLEFAPQVKGLELPAYDPRAGWGQALNYAVANRGGCHLNAYPIGLECLFHFIPPYSTLSKASWVAFMEDFFTAINSTQTCQFTAFGILLEPPVAKYTPRFLLKAAMTFAPGVAQRLLDWGALSGLLSAITGRRIGRRGFLLAGRRAHVLERWMNVLMGVRAADDDLPARFVKEAETRHPVKSVVPIRKLVRAYYRKKGYGPDGVPGPALLARLGIIEPKPAAGPGPAADVRGGGSAETMSGVDPEIAKAYPDERPPRRPLAAAYAGMALGLVGRGFCAAQRVDPDLAAELSGLEPGFRFELGVHPFGPSVRLAMGADGRLRRLRGGASGRLGGASGRLGGLGAAPDRSEREVRMRFTTMSSALSVLSFSASAFEVYAKGGLAVTGDLGATMAIIRALGIVETLLLPAFVARKVLKRPHPLPRWRKIRERLALYLSLPFAASTQEE